MNTLKGLALRPSKCHSAIVLNLASAALLAAVSSLSAQSPHPASTSGSGSLSQAASETGPSKFAAQLALLQQGQLDQARAETQQKLETDPANVEGLVLLGIIESQQQDYANAIASFQSAIKIAPASSVAHNNLGACYLAQNNLDQAEQQFRTVLRSDPQNQNANASLGLVLLTKKTPLAAIPFLERVKPTTAESRFNLIRAHFESKHPTIALRMANELLSANSGDVRVSFTLGLLLASQQQWKPAQIALQKADSLHPGTFEILFNLGQAYLRDQQPQRAEPILNQALHLKPDSAETLALLAQVDAQRDRPLDALDLLLRAHKLAPKDPDIALALARISIEQKYFEDAIPLLTQALANNPQRTDIRLALGECYFQSDKIDQSVEQFKLVNQAQPSARAYSYLGLAYTYLGRFDEARQAFQSGLKLNPHDTFILFHLGYLSERQGDSTAAETIYQKVLAADPAFPYALLELANLRIESKRFLEAQSLLRKYVEVSASPATGYYKLAMVERSLHQVTAADHDLAQFQILSKSASASSHPYDHLFDYVESRSQLPTPAREQQDFAELEQQAAKHPDQPDVLYLLAQACLRTGKVDQARTTIQALDKAAAGSANNLAGAGQLLARYRLYDDAIAQFESALKLDPTSDDLHFNLASAYLKKGSYPQALASATQVSEAGQKNDAYLSLIGDIYARQGDIPRAQSTWQQAIARNPDNDQDYLSLALVQLRSGHSEDAEQTLRKAQTRMPASGRVLWGLGLIATTKGNNTEAAKLFERAVEALPEWPGSYSTLGLFYFQTGQIDKAREVLHRFENSSVGGLDVNRIEQILNQSVPSQSTVPPASAESSVPPFTAENEQRFLQMAFTLADRTL